MPLCSRGTATTSPPASCTARPRPPPRCKFACSRSADGGIRAYDADGPRPSTPAGPLLCHGYDPTRKLRLRRGLRPRVRRAALHLQRARLRERCEQAALKLGFVGRPARRRGARGPRQPRRQRRDPRPGLGARRARQRLLARAGRPDATARSCTGCGGSIFRRAWLDQRVKEGELDVAFDARRSTFAYVQPDRGGEPIELAPEPSWGRVAYVPRCDCRSASARACGDRLARPSSPTSSSGRSVPLRDEVERREAAGAGERARRARRPSSRRRPARRRRR